MNCGIALGLLSAGGLGAGAGAGEAAAEAAAVRYEINCGIESCFPPTVCATGGVEDFGAGTMGATGGVDDFGGAGGAGDLGGGGGGADDLGGGGVGGEEEGSGGGIERETGAEGSLPGGSGAGGAAGLGAAVGDGAGGGLVDVVGRTMVRCELPSAGTMKTFRPSWISRTYCGTPALLMSCLPVDPAVALLACLDPCAVMSMSMQLVYISTLPLGAP